MIGRRARDVRRRSDMQEDIRELCRTFVSMWHEADTVRHVGWRTYSAREHAENEEPTVFSSLPRRAALDRPTSRTLALGRAVLDRLHAFPRPAAAAMREVMTRSLLLTITDAAASTAGRYSRRYLAYLEAHSPFRFTFLREQRRRVFRARESFTGALEAWLARPDEGGTVGPMAGTSPGGVRSLGG